MSLILGPFHIVAKMNLALDAMGIISTKTPELEDEDEIVRQIDEAARHLDISQLALTTQCGSPASSATIW